MLKAAWAIVEAIAIVVSVIGLIFGDGAVSHALRVCIIIYCVADIADYICGLKSQS